MNLLIVDDHPTNLKLLRAQLESEGHAVFEAHNGVDALALLERQRVDVVISDIFMPEMDGYRLCYEIRKHARLHDLPIILCTSTYTSVDDEKLVRDVGADKYLKRPVSLETIVAALHEVLAMPHAAPQPKALQEVEVLKEYSERLVSKLEEKNTGLQAQTEALRASEERYRLLFERATDVIFSLAPMGTIASLNHAFETITGWPPAQWLGQPFQDLIHPDDHTRADELFRLALGGERVPTVELRIRTVAGGFRDVEFTGVSSELSGGRIEVQGIGRDITERLQSEAALREREARLRAIVDNEPECVKVVDKDGRILEMNPAGLRMIEADSLLQAQNTGINSIIVEEHRAAFRALLRKTLQGKSAILEFDIIGLKGTRRALETHAVPLRDERGEVTALLGITRDITGHKRAEALLNGQKRVLEMIAAGAPLEESLTALVRLIEAQAPGMLGSILLLDEDGIHLRHGAAPSLPPEYVGAIDGVSIGPSAGSCGTAAYSKEAVVVEDIATDPRWAEYKAVALPHGLRACSSTPIFDAQRRVLGTFAMYYRQPALPQPDHQRLIDIAVHTAAIAIGRHRTETALRESAERLRFAMQASNVGLWDWDPRTNQVFYSREWKSQLGYEETEIRNEFSEWERLVHPDDLAAAQQHIQHYLARPEGAYEAEFRMRHKDGTWRWIYARGEFFRDASGVAARMMGCHLDLTERKETEGRIVHLNRVYAMLSNINSLIMRARDRDGMFSEACRIAVEAGGFRMAMIAIVDRNTTKIVPVASAGKDEKLLTAIKGTLSSTEGAPTTMAVRAIREKKAVVSNDSQSDPQVLFSKKYTESGIRSLAVFPLIVSDEAVGVLALYAGKIEFFHEEEMKLLTELAGDIAFSIDHIDKQERLNYLAYYDDLTGLANQTLFLERVAQYLRSALDGAHQLAVFLIDLERFKSINDSLGRPAGDELLRQVAQWLIHNVAEEPNLLARVGADHFAVVMPVVKQEGDLALLLEKWMGTFQNHPFYLNDAVFRIALKVGVALFPDDGADANTVFRNAEAALKKAKAGGDRYLFHTHKMTEAVAGNLSLENQLRRALDNGEFVLHYQPKVNLASGKLTGAEALIRWNDPRTGLVPPGHFIPILEETGLIHEVGRWALGQAVEDYLRWRAAGLPAVRIAVNVSPLQLRHRGFISEIEQAIGVDAQAAPGLELEITESVIMENVKHTITSLQAIRAMGVSIAIDDFGTGFSSLSYLAKLPLDSLKIDRSFVIDMTAGPQGLALVSTIISLAHSLNLQVVAEGVETETQSRLLHLLGCDEMQGFLFSKPVPSEIFETRFLAPPTAG